MLNYSHYEKVWEARHAKMSITEVRLTKPFLVAENNDVEPDDIEMKSISGGAYRFINRTQGLTYCITSDGHIYSVGKWPPHEAPLFEVVEFVSDD